MTEKHQSYLKYNHSVLPGNLQVPAHWEVARAKHLFDFITSGSRGWAEYYSDDGALFFRIANLTRDTIEPKLISRQCVTPPSGAEGERSRIRKGDLLISITADLGSVCVADESIDGGYVSQHVALCRPSAEVADSRWLGYVVSSDGTKEQLLGAGYGGTKIQLSLEDIKAFWVPVPRPSERKAIAAFLDYETTRIDTLIAKKQRLIELLKEKRQAVISHAVTKGLNPDSPMKDSGVEWLGEVPEHWSLSPLKYICTFSGGGTPSKDNLSFWNGGDIPWVSPKDMKTFWLTDTQDKITAAAIAESSTNLVAPGALLVVVRSGILQRTIPLAMNKVAVTLNQDMKALRFSKTSIAEYVAYFIRGHESYLLLDLGKQGATVESIEHEYFANLLVPLPSDIEQQSILSYLKKKTTRFELLESKAKNTIRLLQERRAALISAAVTGKIDVRGWQPPAQEQVA